MTLPNDFPFFSGEETDKEKPGSWLKCLERTWTTGTNNAMKIHDFAASLDVDSVAELWWDNLDATRKTTWADVKQEFKMEWPLSHVQDISAATRCDIMMSLKVKEEDLGKMEGEGRRKDYTHAIWADKVEPLWKQLNDKNGLLIPEVRSNLPQSLIDCLPEVPNINKDFKVFLQAVHNAPIKKIMRRTGELKQLHDLEQQVSSLSQNTWTPPSPMSKLTVQLASTSFNQNSYPNYTCPTVTPAQTITTTITAHNPPNPSTTYVPPYCHQTPPQTQSTLHQQPTPGSSTPNPFNNNTTPRPNNMFYQQLQQSHQMSPLAHKGNSQQLAQSAVSQSRVYMDDKTGHQNYIRDIMAWETTYRKDTMMMFTKDHLPLTPGTAPLGSQECYRCGKTGTPENPHIGADCPSPIRIPQCKGSWCSYINKILFPIGQCGNIPHNQSYCKNPMITPVYTTDGEFIEYDPYLYNIDNITFHDDQQGNGLESHE